VIFYLQLGTKEDETASLASSLAQSSQSLNDAFDAIAALECAAALLQEEFADSQSSLDYYRKTTAELNSQVTYWY